jgi:hypothetical protein
MVHVVERDPGGFCLDKELGSAVSAEVVIRPKCSFRRELDDHVPFMGRFVGLVLDVPAEGFEEGIQEVDPDLGLIVALLEVVVLVLLEFLDQRLNVFPERLKISHQSAPLSPLGHLLTHRISPLFFKNKKLFESRSE